MEETAPARRWLSRGQAADHLGVSPSTVDRLVTAGKLRRYKIQGGNIARYDLADLDAVMQPAESPSE